MVRNEKLDMMVIEFKLLLTDPRPDLAMDSRIWQQLFRIIPQLQDRKAAIVLSPRLWYLRAWGTQIKRDHIRTQLVPIIDECCWASHEDFQHIKQVYLRPYATQISQLLQALE